MLVFLFRRFLRFVFFFFLFLFLFPPSDKRRRDDGRGEGSSEDCRQTAAAFAEVRPEAGS